MILQGKAALCDNTGLLAVSVASIGAWTQGKDMDEAEEMMIDFLKEMFPTMNFDFFWINKINGVFALRCEHKDLYAIILKNARQEAGLSLQQAADKAGFKNHNSIYAYEQGKREPTISKFESLLRVYGVDVDVGFAKIA